MKPSEEEQASAQGSFSSETAKILASLGAEQKSGARQVSAGPGGVQARASHNPQWCCGAMQIMLEASWLDICMMMQEGDAAKASSAEGGLTIEQLRHSLPVLSLQWSHGDLHSGEDLHWHPHPARL